MHCTARGNSNAEELHAWLGINLLAIIKLGGGHAPDSSILAEKVWWAIVHTVTKSWT